jgi:hypothetical protein
MDQLVTQQESPVGDMAWFTDVSGFGHDKSARLARLGIIAGAYQAQSRTRGSKWHFRKAKTLAWLKNLEAK